MTSINQEVQVPVRESKRDGTDETIVDDAAVKFQLLDINETALAFHYSDKLDELNVSDLSFLVEYHANIGCYHVYITIPTVNYSCININSLEINVESPTVKLLFNNSNGKKTTWWKTDTKKRVNASNCTIRIKQDHIYLRLPVIKSSNEISDRIGGFSRIAGNELIQEYYTNVTCRTCNGTLLNPKAEKSAHGDSPNCIEKVLPLPSVHWIEMFDYWGGGTGGFEHMPREEIFAQKNRVLIGEIAIIVHDSNTVEELKTSESSLEKDEISNSLIGEWCILRCPYCRVEIGYRNIEEPHTLQLSKHSISATKPNDHINIFGDYSSDSIVGVKILEFMDSHGEFKFCIVNAGGQKCLNINLLGWDTKIWDGIVTTAGTTFQCVLKVLFNSSDVDSSYNSPPGIRELVLPDSIWEATNTRLNGSSKFLPLSMQQMNGMFVGYLFT